MAKRVTILGMITYLHPDQVKPTIKAAMAAYESYLLGRWPKATIEIHSDWNAPDTGGHVNESQHYEGLAVDFHVNGVGLVDAWLTLERIPQVMGIGIYPFWRSPGLHADTRPVAVRARWWRDSKNNYLGVDEQLLRTLIV